MKELSNKASALKLSSTLKVAEIASKLISEGVDIISFGPGEPDFPTPDNICDAAIQAINSGFTKYTNSSGITELRKAVCDKLKQDNNLDYTYEQIIISNGAKHSINNIFTALLNDSDEVLIPDPYWISYAEMVRLSGGVPVIMHTDEKNNFGLTSELLESYKTDKTKIIVLNSPNNPSGIIYNRSELELVADFAVKNDLYVISDEIYEKLTYDGKKCISIASLGNDIFQRTIVVNGFSKSYSMTGWRIGYSASNKKIAGVIANIQSHESSNPNSIAQMAALAALKGSRDTVFKMCSEFAKRRDYIYNRICGIRHVYAVKPQGAFYLFVNISELCGHKINGRYLENADSFAEELLREMHVAVVPCRDFGYDKHIRLSFATSMGVIREGLDRIEKFIASLE